MTELSASYARSGLGAARLRLLSEKRLATLAARGDREAFAVIYQRHHQGLYRYCKAIVESSEDAADALQATMAAALRALPGEEREIALEPWLYRVARNESISIIRRRRPQAELQDTDLATSAGPEFELEKRERLAQLVDDLKGLPEKQRAALVLRELSGLDYRDIGVALEVSEAAAKQAVYHARTGLHEEAKGRDMSCAEVQRGLSERDGRVRRTRRLRAHMRHCPECADFRAAIGQRQSDLSSLAPPLPAVAAAGLLDGILGGGGGSTGLLSALGVGAGKLAGGALGYGVAATVAVVAAGAAAAVGDEERGALAQRVHQEAPRSEPGPSGNSARGIKRSEGQGRGRSLDRRASSAGAKRQDKTAEDQRAASPAAGTREPTPSVRHGDGSTQDDAPSAAAPGPSVGREQAQRRTPIDIPLPAQRRPTGTGRPAGGTPVRPTPPPHMGSPPTRPSPTGVAPAPQPPGR